MKATAINGSPRPGGNMEIMLKKESVPWTWLWAALKARNGQGHQSNERAIN